jgi:hypothetical protein
MTTQPSPVPFVSCLCPTFHRPKLLSNALACFLAQDYPADRRELIIVDDGDDFDAPRYSDALHADFEILQELGTRIRLISFPERFQSLPEKFNKIGWEASGDVLAVWEDDDIYLPWHLSAHVEAMQFHGKPYSKPSLVKSTYPGHLVTEDAAGRFHASIAFTRDFWHRVGHWPVTKRADFDQQFMASLGAATAPIPAPADPCQFAPPSYCFRYGSTQAYHGQHFMRSPDDEGWYDRVPREPGNRTLKLYPQFDDETNSVYAQTAASRAA